MRYTTQKFFVGDIVTSLETGDAGSVKDTSYEQGSHSCLVRWDGFDLSPHTRWEYEGALTLYNSKPAGK